jgi:hypothetical protein
MRRGPPLSNQGTALNCHPRRLTFKQIPPAKARRKTKNAAAAHPETKATASSARSCACCKTPPSAERVPLSGSAGGSYSGDLTVPILGRDLVVEAKARAKGFSQIYSWLQGRDALVIRADRRDALVILPLRLAADIAIAAERGKL